jgi:tetratricopeptide (TPR) repeat protein
MKPSLASIHNDIGVVYFDIKKDIDSAELYYKKGLDLFEKIGSLAGTAGCYINLGNVYFAKQNWKNAQEYHKKAFDIFVKTDNQFGQAYSYNNLGSVYYEQKELDTAIKYYNKALELYENMGLLLETAIAYHNIGVCFKDQNNIDSAMNSLNKAMEIYQQIEDKVGIFQVSYEIAGALKEKGEHKTAIKYYKIYFDTCIQLQDENLLNDAKEKLSQLLSNNNNLSEDILKLYMELKGYFPI